MLINHQFSKPRLARTLLTRKALLSFLGLAMFGFNGLVNAEVITFDGQAAPGDEITGLTTYSEAGFDMTASSAFRILDNRYLGGLPGAGGFAFGQNDETNLTFTHATPFSFTSFDGGALFGSGSGDVQITGTFSGGGTIQSTVTFDDVSTTGGAFRTYNLVGFTNLSQVSIDRLGGNFFGYDNFLFTISGPAPEELSAQTSGLPMANAEGQMLISAGSTVTNDLNGHLFNLRAGDGEEDANDSVAALMDEGVTIGQGDGNPDAKSPIAKRVQRSRQWEIFTTVNYGNVKLNAVNNQAGVQIDSWAPSVGIERHLSRGLAVGFATTFLTSDQNYTSGLGRLHLEGPALSAYASFARKNFWSSLLYSFGSYQLDSRRNPGFGFAQAFGTTRTYTHSVQYNTGWNFRFQNNTLVTGPFAGIDYLHGSVNGYSETGGGLAALTYGGQTYQSLVTRVGWSATKKIQTSWAAITPQVRLGYERQNLTNNGTSVSLINAPFTAAGGNQNPGQSYMVAGAGVNFQFTDQVGLLLSYQTQIFRDNLQAHFASVRLGYKF